MNSIIYFIWTIFSVFITTNKWREENSGRRVTLFLKDLNYNCNINLNYSGHTVKDTHAYICSEWGKENYHVICILIYFYLNKKWLLIFDLMYLLSHSMVFEFSTQIAAIYIPSLKIVMVKFEYTKYFLPCSWIY